MLIGVVLTLALYFSVQDILGSVPPASDQLGPAPASATQLADLERRLDVQSAELQQAEGRLADAEREAVRLRQDVRKLSSDMAAYVVVCDQDRCFVERNGRPQERRR